jgi:nicotinate-nucleotide adenylyltransferase
MTARLGVLGGMFDPIHEGHLRMAEAASAGLRLDQVLVVPVHHPPHRRHDPCASGYHRFAMVALAIADRPAWLATDMELLARGQSYTSVTLRRLHVEGADPLQLFFIAGADAFAEIATWHDYPAILDLAHFAVVSRPGVPAVTLPDRLPSLADRMIMVQVPEDDARVTGAGTPRIWLIDTATPDVSSTEVRRRVQAGEPLDGFVPPSVARYVERHGLYRGTPICGVAPQPPLNAPHR